jgi:hypothetical protein
MDRRRRPHTRLAERLLRLAILSACAGTLALLTVQAVLAESPSPSGPGASAGPTGPAGASPPATATAAATAAATPATASPRPTPASTPAASPAVSLTPAANDTCYNCHVSVDSAQQAIADEWKASVHAGAGIGCADCHGGDPTSDKVTVAMDPARGFQGVPDRRETVDICGTCHSNVERMRAYQVPTDQYAKYRTSVHGQQLLTAGDTRVAICTDCHGTHDVKKASDPTSRVYPLNVPTLCASCHGNANLMDPYGIPTDQFDVYKESVHGQALLSRSDLRAPTCASCHGSHDAKPPQSSEVVNVCGKCHTATQALYEQSRHAELEVGPKCWTCHGTHDVVRPSEERFFHPTPPELECTTCHNLADRQLLLNADRFERDADRRCDTCHHPASLLYAQAQGIYNALGRASTAYEDALARIDEAAGAGMLVTDADVLVTQARTSLIQARAAVHTTKLTDVAARTDAAVAQAKEAEAFAEGRLAESLFRRQAMVVVLALIAVTILALVLLRRQLDHSYERE